MQRDEIRALRGRLAELEAEGQPENLNSFIP